MVPVFKPIPPALKQNALEEDTRPRDLPVDELVQQLVPPARLVVVILKHHLGNDARAHFGQGPVPLALAEVEGAAVVLALDPELGPGVQGGLDVCVALKVHVDDAAGGELFGKSDS